MAAALGADRVIAVVSTEEKARVAKNNGATDVVLADGWLTAVKDLTAGRGVDIVLDPVGGDRFTDSLRALAVGGRLLVVGFTAGEIPTVKVNRLLLNNIEVIGAAWGEWAMTHPSYLREQWAEIEPLIASSVIAPPQVTEYPLEQAAAALTLLDNRIATGKVVVKLR